MPHFVGLDYALETTSVCVLDERGQIACEGRVKSTPKEVVSFLRGQHRRYKSVGLESSTPVWFHAGLLKARLPAVRIETVQAHSVLKTRPNKTDRNDARGIAELMRLGAYRAVHERSPDCRRLRTLLSIRLLLRRKRTDIERSLVAALGEHGIVAPSRRSKEFAWHCRALVRGNSTLAPIVKLLLSVRAELQRGFTECDAEIARVATSDPVCRRLMTAPGVGPVCAVAFRAAVDDPSRFRRSRDVAAYFGLTPVTHQTGNTERRGQISKRGDGQMRRLLFLGAMSVMRSRVEASSLRAWAESVAARAGKKKATVALARRLAVILHRMWVDETEFLEGRHLGGPVGM
jgi:transposase